MTRAAFLTTAIVAILTTAAVARGQTRPRVPILENDTAWSKLPASAIDDPAPLPVWARALAEPLPRTTAAMLNLEYLHRVESPLSPKLRGKIRWVAAEANRCAYAQRYALADLRAAEAKEEQIQALIEERKAANASEQAAIDFIRKLTLGAHTIKDREVEELITRYGEKTVMAIVQLGAYANFQDRLLLSLGLADIEEEVPPRKISVRRRGGARAPQRGLLPEQPPAPAVVPPPKGVWNKADFGALQQSLNLQRERKPRITVPEQDGRERIRWSLICRTYQPELANAWFKCMGEFHRESRGDRVFEESLFWVITRTLDCYY